MTLNEDLVAQARTVTDNLSAVVESLLAEYLTQEKQRRVAEADAVRETVEAQFDVHRNTGRHADSIPYVVVVQSSLFEMTLPSFRPRPRAF